MPATAMFSNFKSRVGGGGAPQNLVDHNPIAQHFEVGKVAGSAGPELVWRVHDAYRKSDGKIRLYTGNPEVGMVPECLIEQFPTPDIIALGFDNKPSLDRCYHDNKVSKAIPFSERILFQRYYRSMDSLMVKSFFTLDLANSSTMKL